MQNTVAACLLPGSREQAVVGACARSSSLPWALSLLAERQLVAAYPDFCVHGLRSTKVTAIMADAAAKAPMMPLDKDGKAASAGAVFPSDVHSCDSCDRC